MLKNQILFLTILLFTSIHVIDINSSTNLYQIIQAGFSGEHILINHEEQAHQLLAAAIAESINNKDTTTYEKLIALQKRWNENKSKNDLVKLNWLSIATSGMNAGLSFCVLWYMYYLSKFLPHR